MTLLFLPVCLAALAGCAVGPDFKSPQPEMPADWSGRKLSTDESRQADLARWWSVFNDPILTSLVERAAASNLDLKLAEARVRQARAARGVATAKLGPALDATGSFRRAEAGDSGPVANQYQTGFDAAWEIDIFGGTRRSLEATNADLQSAVESRADTLVTLTAEVARNYVELRAYQQQIVIARRNLTAQQHSMEVTRKRFEGGLVSGLDVANASAQVASTTSRVPQLESSARQTIHSLSILVGRDPAALMEELSSEATIPEAPPAVPLGVPSDLLRRRPDIRVAEADIHAATARIGVATADLFPKFTLSGSLGWQADDTSSLFQAESRSWSLGPSVSWRIFESGSIRSGIEEKKALQDQSLITYRQTVLDALADVENALIASAKEQERRDSLVEVVAANRKAVELATQLYSEGETDFLSVLDAQRSLYSSEDALVQSTKTVSTNLIALFKALGGGWEAPDTAIE